MLVDGTYRRTEARPRTPSLTLFGAGRRVAMSPGPPFGLPSTDVMRFTMRARRLWFGLLGTLTLASPPARAGAQPVGSEFQVNTYTTGNQEYASVAADANGNFVVIWQSDGQDGPSSGVFGQRFDSEGNSLGNEFRVNTYTTGNQRTPSVAADSSGNFVVVWSSDGQDGSADGIFGQRYDSAGDTLGSEFQINSYTLAWQQNPVAASDASGNFVVVWQSGHDGDSWGVFGQRFDRSAVPRGDEFQVNTYTGWHQWFQSVTSDASGTFVVVWQSLLPGSSGYEVMAQRYDSEGEALGVEFRVNSHATGSQQDPAVASDASGNFVVVWRGAGLFGQGVFGQRYDSGGVALGSEFRGEHETLAHLRRLRCLRCDR
jgi:hypothetical protein